MFIYIYKSHNTSKLTCHYEKNNLHGNNLNDLLHLPHNAPFYNRNVHMCPMHCAICEIDLFVGGLDMSLTRHSALTGKPWGPNRRCWLFSPCWLLQPTKIRANKNICREQPTQPAISQHVVSLIIKMFCHKHHCILNERTINLNVWINEIGALFVTFACFNI